MENEMQNEEATPTKKAKPLSSVQSAKQRAEEIRKNGGGTINEGADEFYVDLDVIPDGWTYEWKRFTVYGQEDPSYQVQLRRAGWEPVPAARHPEMMPVGYTDTIILRKGMILMERPAEITAEVRAEERKLARDQIRAKEAQLNDAPAGQFERSNKDAPLAKVKKGFEPIPIPED